MPRRLSVNILAVKTPATPRCLLAAFLFAAALPRCASVSRYPLSVSRPSESGPAAVAFGLDLAALASSVTNEAGACVSRLALDIPARTETETDITGGQTVARSDAAGRVTSVSRPDGVLVSNVVNALGQTTEVRLGGAPVLGLGRNRGRIGTSGQTEQRVLRNDGGKIDGLDFADGGFCRAGG
jgi:hypothetical protein